MSTTFSDLGVPGRICDLLNRRGITKPFEIQAATIADALEGRDVCGRAPTGSGKTLAFGIPLLADVEKAEPREPRALILAPTRELAEQISKELLLLAGNVSIGVVYGGVSYGPQLNALRKGVDILVACPGRLEDLIDQGALSLASVNRVVLDEADRMADMGFMPAVRRLLDQTDPDRQTVLFSATLDDDVARLTRDYQRNPVKHEVGDETPDITTAQHVFWNATQGNRREIAAEAIDAVWPTIIFCRTRHGSDRLSRQLSKGGLKTAAIHGGRSQAQRTKALGDFKNGHIHALVATDVAARGIHVDGVASVIHFDPPEDHKAYVHRSGRTARAGKTGVVISLVQPNQLKDMRRMQRRVGLEEPCTEPDATALWRLSPVPAHSPRDADTKRSKSDHNNRSSDRSSQSQKPNSRNAGANRSRNGSGTSPTRKKNQNRHRGRSASNGSSVKSRKSQSGAGSGTSNRNEPQKQNSVAKGSNGNTAKAVRRKGSNSNKRGRHPAKTANGGNRKARRAHLQRTSQ